MYRSFVADFPSRCHDLLTGYWEDAKSKDREVTLMLAVAAAGFVTPYERLKRRARHPSGDRGQYTKAAEELDSLLDTCFLTSEFAKPEPSDWRWYSPIAHAAMIAPWGAETLECDYQVLAPDFTVGQGLAHLRNAIAHGSIFVRGTPVITQLVLLTRVDRKGKQYGALAVTPNAFRCFLVAWFDFLVRLPLPQSAMPRYVMELRGSHTAHTDDRRSDVS